jgi:hypothetical protein
VLSKLVTEPKQCVHVYKLVHVPPSLSKIASERLSVSTCLYRLSIYIFIHVKRQTSRETDSGDILSTFVHICPHVRHRKRPTRQTALTTNRKESNA